MFTTFKRIFKSGFVNFWRNGFVSLATVLVMTITLFVIGGVVFLSALLDDTLTQFRNKVDVNVYFVTDALEEDILDLKRSLEGLSEVATVEYVSREDSLAEFRQRHEGDQLVLQALDELGSNPLGAVLNIRATETSQYESIARFLEDQQTSTPGEQAIIDDINFFQNKAAIDKLTDIIRGSERIGLAMTLFLVIISILIIFNTIRLAIYTTREEISVMRLVGASNTYIQGPFVVEGVLYGVAASIITLLVFFPTALWLGPITARFFGSINVFTYYLSHFWQFVLVLVLSGVILGGISSFLAVKKYLKV